MSHGYLGLANSSLQFSRRVQDSELRTRKNLKLFLMSHLKSFAGAIESVAITDGSAEDILQAVEDTDLDWNVVLRMCRRITQERRLLRLPHHGL